MPDHQRAHRTLGDGSTVSVIVAEGSRPIDVRAPGINYARFTDFTQVYSIFGGFMPLIALDYEGHKAIVYCMEELGFVAPAGYFT